MDQIKIGKFITEMRHNKGMTQVQLAEKLSITDRAVSKWENGKCLPDSSIMLELCDILGISVNELLNGEIIIPEEIPQTAEENLIALKKDSEKQKTISNRFIAGLLALVFILTAGGIRLAVTTIRKRRELETNQKSFSGMYSTIGDSAVLTEEAKRVIHLITGSYSSETFVFSYQIDESCKRIKLYSDTYSQGEKIQTSLLLTYDFKQPNDYDDPPNEILLPEESGQNMPAMRERLLTGYPKQGLLFFDCVNRHITLSDEYYVESKMYDANGAVVEDFEIYRTDSWVPGTYPETLYPFGYRYNLSSGLKETNGKILAEQIGDGEPVYLFLFGDNTEKLGSLEASKKSRFYDYTVEDILADSKLIGSFSACDVFYCVFE